MTTNAALAFCSDAWWGLILNVFWGPQGGTNFTGGRGPLAPPWNRPWLVLVLLFCMCPADFCDSGPESLNYGKTVEDIDGYMLRAVWPALNSLSTHVIFTAIVPGAYPGEAKVCKNVRKWRPLDFTAWITGKRLKIAVYIHAAMRLTSIEFSFDPCDGPRGVGYPADARSVGVSHPSC